MKDSIKKVLLRLLREFVVITNVFLV